MTEEQEFIANQETKIGFFIYFINEVDGGKELNLKLSDAKEVVRLVYADITQLYNDYKDNLILEFNLYYIDDAIKTHNYKFYLPYCSPNFSYFPKDNWIILCYCHDMVRHDILNAGMIITMNESNGKVLEDMFVKHKLLLPSYKFKYFAVPINIPCAIGIKSDENSLSSYEEFGFITIDYEKKSIYYLTYASGHKLKNKHNIDKITYENNPEDVLKIFITDNNLVPVLGKLKKPFLNQLLKEHQKNPKKFDIPKFII